MFTGVRRQDPASSGETVNKAIALTFADSKQLTISCKNIAKISTAPENARAVTLAPAREFSQTRERAKKRMKKMMLLVASIISLGLQCVTGAPQLRLSHTGYEIISFNDQTPEDSLPVRTKLAPRNASRYSGIDFLNLEKADTTVDDESEVGSPLQQRKRHYDSQSSTPGSRASSETRGNIIVPSGKVSSGEVSEKTDVYLAVGVPTRFDRPRESSSVSSDSEVTTPGGGPKNSFEDSRREKIAAWMSRARLDDRETGTAKKSTKQSSGSRGGDKTFAVLDSDVDSADQEDSRFDKITALVVGAKAASDAKRDGEAETRQAFPTVGKLPLIQIHRQRSFYIPTKSPAMFSPIYPSGFDIVTGNFVRKNVAPGVEQRRTQPRNFRPESTNTKNRKYAVPDVEARKKTVGAKEFAKSYLNERAPSILTLKNILGGVGHDILGNRGNGNGSPLSGLLPVPAGTSLYVSPLSLMLRQPFRALRPAETHLELNSMPLIASHVEHAHPTGDSSILQPQGRFEDMSNSVIDAPRARPPDNYLDSKYLESKLSHRISKSGPKVDFFKNYLGKMSGLNSWPAVRSVVVNEPARELLATSAGAAKGSLVIDIVHEAPPDDRDERVVDVDKEDAAKEVHEMQDAHQASSSASPKSSCKRMKAGAPPFYQFLSKFSDIVVENALRYEAGLRVREDVAKNNLERASGVHDFVNF